MIPVTYIKRNVNHLGTSYRKSHKPINSLLYAKLAIIEVGGWVEISMDDLISRAGARLMVAANKKHLEKKIIERTWGFDYHSNFRSMLIQVVGIICVEKIEKSVNAGIFAKMQAALTLLKTARHDVAHTYIKNATFGAPIPAPSVVLSYFADIYAGLKDIEATMRKMRLI